VNINDLPPEVLQIIFTLLHNDICYLAIPYVEYQPIPFCPLNLFAVPWTLRRICRRWRRIAEDTRALWRDVAWSSKWSAGSPPDVQKHADSLLDEWIGYALRTSTSSDIHDHSDLTLNICFHSPDSVYLDFELDVLTSFMSHSNVWKHADFIISPEYLPTLSGIKGRLDNLQVLRLDCVIDPKDDQGKPQLAIEEKRTNHLRWLMDNDDNVRTMWEVAPKLETVILVNYSMKTTNDCVFPWRQLQRFEMNWAPGCDWAGILRKARHLQIARFISRGERDGTFSAGTLKHESLAELNFRIAGEDLGYGGQGTKELNSLILPNLQRLRIIDSTMLPAFAYHTPFAPARQLVERSNCPLRCLFLTGTARFEDVREWKDLMLSVGNTLVFLSMDLKNKTRSFTRATLKLLETGILDLNCKMTPPVVLLPRLRELELTFFAPPEKLPNRDRMPPGSCMDLDWVITLAEVRTVKHPKTNNDVSYAKLKTIGVGLDGMTGEQKLRIEKLKEVGTIFEQRHWQPLAL